MFWYTPYQRDGGEVVRAEQQGWVGLQERDVDIVWLGSKRRQVRTDDAEVETGLDERVVGEGTQVWVLRRCAPEAELAPMPMRELAQVWVGEMDSAAGRTRKVREEKHTIFR
jgi:hypothetical protein